MENGKNLEILKAVTFAILMENHGGILGKSYDYVKEKYRATKGAENEDELLALLDYNNAEKYKRWKRIWMS